MRATPSFSSSAALHPVGPSKTLFFGDSITVGEGLPYPEEERWAALVSAACGWVEINEGKGGRPSSAWEEFCGVLRARKDDPHIGCFVVALGGNDARDPAPDIADQVSRNVNRMIDRVRQEAPAWAMVVVGPYNINRVHLREKDIAELRERNLVAIDASLQALAQAKGCSFVPFLGELPPGTLIADGVHPDSAGHEALAFKFLSALPHSSCAKACGNPSLL